MRGDETIEAGQARRLQHGVVLGVGAAQRDVVAQRGVEQHRVLGDVTEVATQVGRVPLRDVDTVDQHHPGSSRVQAFEQSEQGALARTDPPEHGDVLARGDFERKPAQGLHAATRIGERHVPHADSALDLGAVGELPAGPAFGRLAHQAAQRQVGGSGLLVAHHQPGELLQGREPASSENDAGDQGADGQFAGGDEMHPPEDHHHRGELDHRRREMDHGGRHHARLVGRASGGRTGLLVTSAHEAFRAQGLEGLHALDGFDQQAVTLGGDPHVLLHRARQGPLRDEPDHDHQRYRQQRDEVERTAEQEHDEDEKSDERHVHEGGEGRRSDEIPHRIEFAELRGEHTGRSRPPGHGNAQRLREDLGREGQIGLAPGSIEKIGAQCTCAELEGDGQRGAESQYGQGFERVVRHHAVVDVHHVEGTGHGQHVDQQAGQRGLEVIRRVRREGAPEPRLPRPHHGFRADGRRRQLRLGEQDITGVDRLELARRHLAAAETAVGQDDLGDAIVAAADQYAGRTVDEQQGGRQQEIGNTLQPTSRKARRVAMFLGGAHVV